MEYIDCAYKITDEQAFLTARAFARTEGILIGPSSGACALVALKLAQELGPHDRIVCMISDGGDRYIQTLFNDEWMEQQGFAASADMTAIREMARSLQPWSSRPAESANYRSDLTISLEVPESTLRLNSEVLSQGYHHRESSFFID
jgi:cystathionine beta-synthase/cysteine synthase A